jgi:hypothetical protein
VQLNLGTDLPADTVNALDALTASGFNTLANDTSVPGGNAVQKAVANALEASLASDPDLVELLQDVSKQAATVELQDLAGSTIGNIFPEGNTDTIKKLVQESDLDGVTVQKNASNKIETIPDGVVAQIADDVSASAALVEIIPLATDTVAGRVALATGDNFPSNSDTEAATPAYVNAAVEAMPSATDTVRGLVELNLGNTSGDDSNVTDALTASGFNTLANSTELPVNEVQLAIANALEQSLPGDAGLVQVIQDTAKLAATVELQNLGGNKIGNIFPEGNTQSIQKVLQEADLDNISVHTDDNDKIGVIPDGVVALIADDESASAALVEIIPVATDTTKGRVALNQGTDMPADATNSTDALTAFGLRSMLNDDITVNGNPIQRAVVNAVEQSIGNDAGAAAAILAALPNATDTLAGKVSLAVGQNFPSVSDTEAVTPAYTTLAIASALAGTGKVQQGTNVTITGDGSTAAPHIISVADAGNTVKGAVALNLGDAPGDATNSTDALTANGLALLLGTTNTLQQSVVAAVPVATDTVQGKVSLAVAANHPSVSETEAATPAYVTAAISSAASFEVIGNDGSTVLFRAIPA